MLGLLVALSQVGSQSYEIKWKPSVGQVLRYSCEWGGPIQATDAVYIQGRSASTVRVVAVTTEHVLLEFTTEAKDIRFGGAETGSKSGSVTVEKVFRRNGEPLEIGDFLPTSALRGMVAAFGTFGLTYPEGSYYPGTSWGVTFDSGRENQRRAGTALSTFEGLDAVDGTECFKISCRALSLQGRHVQERSGTVWLDRRDGSIVRLLEGERPKAVTAAGNDAIMKLPSYVDLRLTRE